jgi:uncharacterized membrane protein YkoI
MIRIAALLLVIVAAPGPADGDGMDDHDRARQAVERGDALPLGSILRRVEAETGGRVIEVEFERDDGRWMYELEVITPDGRLLEVEVDGATGRIFDHHDSGDGDDEDNRGDHDWSDD